MKHSMVRVPRVISQLKVGNVGKVASTSYRMIVIVIDHAHTLSSIDRLLDFACLF